MSRLHVVFSSVPTSGEVSISDLYLKVLEFGWSFSKTLKVLGFSLFHDMSSPGKVLENC